MLTKASPCSHLHLTAGRPCDLFGHFTAIQNMEEAWNISNLGNNLNFQPIKPLHKSTNNWPEQLNTFFEFLFPSYIISQKIVDESYKNKSWWNSPGKFAKYPRPFASYFKSKRLFLDIFSTAVSSTLHVGWKRRMTGLSGASTRRATIIRPCSDSEAI